MANNTYNVRQMQVYAGLCFRNYCEHFKFSQKDIEELISHLISIAKEENLPNWNSKGCNLAISGRGDQLPEHIITLVGKKYDQFVKLLECVVEVGIVDLFGANTDNPKTFSEKCKSILKKEAIALPETTGLHDLNSLNHWGHALSSEQYCRLLDFYNLEF